MPKLTQERLKKLLHYDPETGVFIRKKTLSANAIKGGIAGSSHNCGYLQLQIDGKKYLIHRLIWLYIYGYFPETNIDHINRRRSDNRIKNLREVSQSCNCRNSNIKSNNKTGITGTCWASGSKKWMAHIKINYNLINLGYFKEFKDAVLARWEAEKKYNFPNCNTVSTAYLYLQEHKYD